VILYVSSWRNFYDKAGKQLDEGRRGPRTSEIRGVRR
jgi:hypothetical protein